MTGRGAESPGLRSQRSREQRSLGRGHGTDQKGHKGHKGFTASWIGDAIKIGGLGCVVRWGGGGGRFRPSGYTRLRRIHRGCESLEGRPCREKTLARPTGKARRNEWRHCELSMSLPTRPPRGEFLQRHATPDPPRPISSLCSYMYGRSAESRSLPDRARRRAPAVSCMHARRARSLVHVRCYEPCGGGGGSASLPMRGGMNHGRRCLYGV
jgi:hypothetical protein